MRKVTNISIIILLFLLMGCRHDVVVPLGEQEHTGDIVPDTLGLNPKGFYLLNEGNMGSNKATIDYYDFPTATYTRNLYVASNPDIVRELGDVGNDLQIYGSRLYAVINCSNKVEVCDAHSCRRIGQVDIPNCRYIRFKGRYAYVTSFAGPVEISSEHKQLGYVARFDTATLEILDHCMVSYQPEELEIYGQKIYVANSGGYLVPNYENSVSVIDAESFTETKRITVAPNLHHVTCDQHGQLWVTSRGDYYNHPSRLYCIDTTTDELIDSVMTPISNCCIVGDSLYYYATEWSYIEMKNSFTYGIVDVVSHEIITRNFITDHTDENIKIPYGIMVNPVGKDIYLTDAKDYVTPGTLYCFSPSGQCRWSVRTGDIPAHFALLIN